MKLTVAVQCYKAPHYDEYLILPNFLFKAMVVLHNCCFTNSPLLRCVVRNLQILSSIFLNKHQLELFNLDINKLRSSPSVALRIFAN